MLIALGIAGVFAIALWLDPYQDGRVWLEETHRQLGMRPCTVKAQFGIPCPSCGMTSSFALLAHGDVLNALRANFAGVLLAIFLAIFAVWGILCSLRGKVVGIRDPFVAIFRFSVIFFCLMMARWAWIVCGVLIWGD